MPYRLQMLELPDDGATGHRFFGAGYSETKMLMHVAVAEAQVLPVMGALVALLQTAQTAQENTTDG